MSDAFIDVSGWDDLFTLRADIEQQTAAYNATGQKAAGGYAAVENLAQIPACKYQSDERENGREVVTPDGTRAYASHTFLLQGLYAAITPRMRARIESDIYDILAADTNTLTLTTTLQVQQVK